MTSRVQHHTFRSYLEGDIYKTRVLTVVTRRHDFVAALIDETHQAHLYTPESGARWRGVFESAQKAGHKALYVYATYDISLRIEWTVLEHPVGDERYGHPRFAYLGTDWSTINAAIAVLKIVGKRVERLAHAKREADGRSSAVRDLRDSTFYDPDMVCAAMRSLKGFAEVEPVAYGQADFTHDLFAPVKQEPKSKPARRQGTQSAFDPTATWCEEHIQTLPCAFCPPALTPAGASE